jgi:hypothetical protein
MKTHRELYPNQYTHPMVGKVVKVRTNQGGKADGTVERVVPSRFGPLAILEDQEVAWSIRDCEVIDG